MNKSYVILCMYEDLIGGKTLRIKDCQTEYSVSVPTFRRYIALLREYFAERRAVDIVYDKEAGGYRTES
ncbi:MAG: hypothetical protein IJY62_01275 [Clostridia bacterium]|nr:hypothetical protein [Clostridia bacterium]